MGTRSYGRVGLVFAALAATAGCATTGGGAPGSSGSGGVGTVVPGVTSGAPGSGGGGDGGPWPVGLTAGEVIRTRPGHYCGGPDPTMSGRVTLTVPRGPVSITLAWLPDQGGTPLATSTVDFAGTGPQTKTATATWVGSWFLFGAKVRVQATDIEPGPGAGEYRPPDEHVITYEVLQCTSPDIDVAIPAVQVPPQPCGNPAQAIAVANVTLNSPTSASTGGVRARLRWRLNESFYGDWIDLAFEPGGPKTLPVNTVWTLVPNRPYEAAAIVEVSRSPMASLFYYADAKNFFTNCIS